jgi:phage-related protein
MPSIGSRCHELRIKDNNYTWRLIYRIDPDAIIIVDVFDKNDNKTPQLVIDNCKHRLMRYDKVSRGEL